MKKENQSIKLKASKGTCSIDMPSCGMAYVPKVNMRRPGNIMFLILLIFIMSLLAGLAFADDHKHSYGNVDIVVNVASISIDDLAKLRRNQMPIRVNGPTIPNYSMVLRTDDDMSNRLNSLNDQSEASTTKSTLRGLREETETSVMRDFRAPLPLDQARVLLNNVPFSWPGNDSINNLLADWQMKYTVMTDEQNLGMINHLLNHFQSNRGPRSIDHLMALTLETAEHKERTKRSASSEARICEDLKTLALKANDNRKKEFIMGWKFMSEDYLCLFARECAEGMYPNLSGCQSSPDSTPEKDIDYHVSSVNFAGTQNPLPLVDLSKVCTLGSIKLKDCSHTYERNERVTFYKSQGQSKYWIGDSSINLTPIYVGLADFNCTGEKSKQCDGDEVFKATYTTAGSDSSCFCRANTNKSVVHLTMGAETFRVDLVFFDHVQVSYQRHDEEELLCMGCEMTCEKGEIKIDYTHEVEMVELCSGRFCIDLKPEKVFTIPLSLAAIDHSYKYYVRFDNNKEMEGTIQCKVEDLCPLIDCHLCYEKLKNPHCYNVIDKMNFIILLAVWFLILAIAVKLAKLGYYLLMIVKNVFKACFKVGFWITKRVCGFMGTQVLRVTEVTSKAEEQWDGTIKTVRHEQKKIIFKPRPTYIKSIVLLTLFLPVILSCTETKVLTSSQLNCLMTGQDLSCKTLETISISVAPVGQSSCFVLKALDGRILGVMTVRTLSLDLLCNEQDLYYVFPAKPTFDQKCYCTASSTGWGSDESCDGYNHNTKCGKPLSCPASLQTSGCMTAQGGWEQSCFSYGAQYCYYRVAFENPSGSTFKISQCTSFYWEAQVELKIQTLNNTRSIKASLNPGSKLAFPGGNLQLISASVPPMPILSSCFLKSTKGVFVTNCVKGNGIVAGMVGEIQCSSASAAKAPSNEKCSFARGIWAVNRLGGRLELTTSLFDYSKKMTKLPASSGGYLIKHDEGQIKASLNYISMMTIRLTLTDMKAQPYSVDSKCQIRLVSLQGCVSCLTGAILKLRAKATGSETKAILDCPSLKAQIPFTVKMTEEVVRLNAHFENGKINENCRVVCPGNSINLAIKADLVSDVQVTRSAEEHLSDYTEVVSNWMRDVFGQFDTMLKYGVIGVIIVGSIILVRVLLTRPEQGYHSKRF